MAQINLSTGEKTQYGYGEQTCACKGRGEESGMYCELGLIYANYCIWSG